MIAPRSFFLIAIVVVLALNAAEVDADKAPRSPGRQLQMKMGKDTKTKGGKSTKSPAPPEPDCDFVCACIKFFFELATETSDKRRLQADDDDGDECDPDEAADQFAKFSKEAAKGLEKSGLFTPSQEKVVGLVAQLLPLMIDPCQFNDIAQFFLANEGGLDHWLMVGAKLQAGLETACGDDDDRARRLVTVDASQVNRVKGFIVAFFDPEGEDGYPPLLYTTVQILITFTPVTGFFCNDGAATEIEGEYQYRYQEECDTPD